MFRMSGSWGRIQPSPDKFDEAPMDRYEKIMLNLPAHKLRPLITLYHFTLPNWLAKEGGLNSPRFPEYFSRYVLKVVQRLSAPPARVRWWMTINEPLVPIAAGYILGIWPPGHKSFFEALSAAKNLVRAQNEAMKSLHSDNQLSKNLMFSVAYHWRDVETDGFGPFSGLAKRVGNWLANTWFLDSISAATDLNYLGINYYGRYVLHWQWAPPFIRLDEGEGPRTDLGWVIAPQNLSRSLEDAYNTYHLPVLISENGIADANDSKRPEFLKSHIEEIRKARQNGANVIGYLHWSLTDNFEWAEGLTPRFGLVEMNYAQKQRKPRASFKVYKEIIHRGL